MSVIKRWGQILAILQEEQAITVDDLCTRLSISPATARRDFASMEEQGLIQRFPGGARVIEQHATTIAAPIEQRMIDNAQIKNAIARKAASFVRDNDAIFLDASSTTHFMLDHITAQNITVITNSLHIALRATDLLLRTYVLGGFSEQSGRLLDSEMASRIASMNISKAFIGVFGIAQGFGLSTNNMNEVEYKRRLIGQALNTYTLADHTKFDVIGLYSYGTLDDTTIITDRVPEGYTNGRFLLA